jgi:D-3-phosphoglycerate dehydrogenase
MPKILVLDGLSEQGVEVFRQAEGFEVDVKPPQKPDELAAIINDYDGLVVRSATKVPAEVLKGATRLKVIGRAGVGTDNIDKAAATEQGIVVMNTPGGNTISTCEHAFALLFALCRNVPKANLSMQEGRWDRKKFMGTEICGKTLGIIGVGRIGGEFAKRAQAFKMRVLAFDPVLTKLKAEALGVELVSLDELIEQSDVISIHAPKTDKTNNMIRAEHFKKMKDSCRIINCARGGIVNEHDLAEALKSGDIAGAALDVYTSEPFENNPFIGLDNIVTTPHLAASTDEAQLIVAVDVAKQMVNYLTTGAIENAVNVPSLDSEQREALSPYLALAEGLGKFLGNYMEGRPSKLEIEYRGDFGVTDTYPITATIISGFLMPLMDQGNVNMVSAPAVLQQHGIECAETKAAASSDYAFEFIVRITTDVRTYSVGGTLFQEDPRICLIDDTRVDAQPSGWMLVCLNEDKPLIVGPVATIVGEAGINIANMTLGRDARGGRASMVLNLDDALPDEVLEKIRQVPHINFAQLVAFD